MEVYKTAGAMGGGTGPDRVRVERLLQLREMEEQLFQQLHAVHEILQIELKDAFFYMSRPTHQQC